MRTHTHNDRDTRQTNLASLTPVSGARAAMLKERRDFQHQMIRHYLGNSRGRVGLITPRDGTGDIELFINGRRIGRFLAEKQYLVFSVHNDASPQSR